MHVSMARTMTLPYLPRAEVRPPAFAAFFNKLLSPVRDLFVKPALPDPSLVFSEIKRVHFLLLESPRDRGLGKMMHLLIIDYETQTRELAMHKIRKAPKLKNTIMDALKADREKAYQLAFDATRDPAYASKLGHYDWKI